MCSNISGASELACGGYQRRAYALSVSLNDISPAYVDHRPPGERYLHSVRRIYLPHLLRDLILYRCPMECRLTRSDKPWQCQVLLRRETDANGDKIRTREEPFGPLLTDKGELEEMLRRAQLAILNPSVEADKFVDLDTSLLEDGEWPLGSVKQLSFSDNVVCMDISGPDLTDLSFIDLPGM